ncbi:sulfite exporter TauE/SafE family protein [Litoribacillus peritrichatus]|uniref:Probable membrane transporter protein n=1 Tax=Litoribacillus peritrichatus TaxID=718191 RepID=A0ABP7NCM8_9GAMM
MPIDLTLILGLFLIAFVANAFSAMAGGGAGLLQLPALLFLGLAFTPALATHKIASVALGLGASIRHFREGSIHWPFSLFILGCGLPGVIVGASVIIHIPDFYAQLALGLLTIGLGFYSAFKPNLGNEANLRPFSIRGYLIGGGVIFFIGFLNGSLTSGTGLFVTIWLVRWFGLDYLRAVTYTLILVGLFWNATGAMTLALQAPVEWAWLPSLLLGSLLGGYAGAHISIAKGNTLIKRTFEVMTIATGLSLVVKAFW